MTPHQLIITVGVPGSGKSTLAERARTAGVPVVSSDAVRAELLGDAADQGQADRVWVEVHRRLTGHLIVGSVLLDATNLNPAHRAPLLDIARSTGAIPVVWRLTTWHRTSRAANRRRARRVPREVMDAMVELFDTHCSVEALTEEGWQVRNVARQALSA